MTPEGKVIVVGGGIGGLTAALALQRTRISAVVYERRKELSEVNTGFLLWSFAIRRLRALGLGEGLERIGEPLTRLVHRSWRGRELSDVSLEPLNKTVGAPSYDVHRAGLQALLAEAVGKDAIHLGQRCVGVNSGERPAAVLEGGAVVNGEVVLGADGVNSEVRRHVLGEVELQRHGAVIWRGVAELGQDVVRMGEHIRVVGPGALFGVGRLDERTVRWYAGVIGPDQELTGGGDPIGQAKAQFADWAEPAPTVIDATEPTAFLRNDAPRARPLPRWSRGSVGLLGDAAHPTLPTLAMGGGMAIEDAVVLAECLSASAESDSALRDYERRRKRASRRVQRESVAFGGLLALRRGALVKAREAGLRAGWAQRKAIERLMRGD